ncbi:MAG: hypothetical protein WCO66_02370 [Candidatus Absconditabacteria bacterium]
MTDSTTPQTFKPMFTLNIEPSTEVSTAPVVPEIGEKPNDDRLKKEDQLVESQIKSDIVDPILTDVGVEPKTILRGQTAETPVVETTPKVIPEMKIEEISAEPKTILRGQTADTPKIETTPEVIPEVKIEETPKIETTPEIIPEVKIEEAPKVEMTPEVIPEVKIEEAPKVETQTTNFQKDLQIIQNIQQVPVSTQPVQTVAVPIEKPVIATANSFNLDSISAEIPKPQTPPMGGITPPQIGPIPTAPNIPANPYDHLQNYIPQIAAGSTNTSKKTTEIGVGVLVGFVVLAWFVMKTMYPIQYNDIVGGIFGTSEDSVAATIETPLSGDVLSGDILSGDMLSGDILSGEINSGNVLFGSGDTLLDSGVLDGNTGNMVSSDTNTGDTHNVADTTTSLIPDTIPTPTISADEFKTQLESYSKQGKLAVLKAKKSNDKELIKNSLALYKKADASLQDIANGKEITTDDMNTILSELSGYLAKPTSTDASVPVTQTPIDQPIDTSSTGFNPDAFFGTSGTSQN